MRVHLYFTVMIIQFCQHGYDDLDMQGVSLHKDNSSPLFYHQQQQQGQHIMLKNPVRECEKILE